MSKFFSDTLLFLPSSNESGFYVSNLTTCTEHNNDLGEMHNRSRQIAHSDTGIVFSKETTLGETTNFHSDKEVSVCSVKE